VFEHVPSSSSFSGLGDRATTTLYSRILILVLVPNLVRYIISLIVAGTDKTYMMRLYQPSQPFFSVFHCIEASRCTVSRSHIEYLGTCLHAKAKASKTTIESTVSVVILE
jgi:hypothetical protein